ncbi:hypothetical protein [Lysinibacillus sp. NPDC093216]|uniref:hypothetical protein n=1 Tax=Lysinibacillus sp. NPDC093216 TaxID=3390576 RepID=UPI003CFC92DC
MKNRSKAYIRHQRERIIRKKLTIVKNVFSLPGNEYKPIHGKLSKGKVHCSCRMCRYEQYHSIPKAKIKAKLKAMEQEIDEYVYFFFSMSQIHSFKTTFFICKKSFYFSFIYFNIDKGTPKKR